MKHAVVIVAGGSGKRMQSDLPKQFIVIHGKPVVLWTLEKFRNFDPEIECVLVLPASFMRHWEEITGNFPEFRNIQVVEGGSSRFESVLNGLGMVNTQSLVGIHDAVRPLVSVETIRRCYEEAAVIGNAVPAIDSEDTLRIISDDGVSLLDRKLVKRIQTPQVFHASELLKAYRGATGDFFTDDASVFEAYGGKIHIVQGNKENIKLTYPSDLEYASVILQSG